MVSYDSLTDTALSRLIPHDDSAFDEIYERYWSILYRHTYNVLRDQEACFDIVQEVYIWLWEHRKSTVVESVKGYLLAAVKYKAANYIRHNKVKQSFYERIPKLDLETDFPDQAVELKELKEIINVFVMELPERCQEVFNLSRNEHLTNKEIAVRLGISEKTVENQINKALKRLKLGLGKSFFLVFFL
jgi:RNA polymerase sigma-70 factor (family 1)